MMYNLNSWNKFCKTEDIAGLFKNKKLSEDFMG